MKSKKNNLAVWAEATEASLYEIQYKMRFNPIITSTSSSNNKKETKRSEAKVSDGLVVARHKKRGKE